MCQRKRDETERKTHEDVGNEQYPLEFGPFHFFLAFAVPIGVVVVVSIPDARFAAPESFHASSSFWKAGGVSFAFSTVWTSAGRHHGSGESGGDIDYCQRCAQGGRLP